MANEIQWRGTETGVTLYATIRSAAGTQWNTAGTPNFEAVTAANWADYDIALAESSGNYFYTGTFPAISGNMVAGWYWVDVYKRAGGSPAITDTLQGTIVGYWDGTSLLPWASNTKTVSDKTGYSLMATTGLGNQTANITGNLSGSVGSVTGAVGSVTGAVGSVTAGVALTSGERTTLAAAIEAAIINELDGTAVMQAIADLIASDMTTTDLTVAAIASAVRDAILNRVLAGNHDTTGTVGKVLQDTLEDTGTTLPSTLSTILTDTDELQKAITDGGRTDLLIDAIKAKTDAMPSAATISTQVASDLAAAHGAGSWATATSVTVSDKTGFKLASDGLDSVTTTAPTGPATNFREMVVQTWRRFFKRSTRTYSGGTQQIVTYADNGTTPVTTQTISDDGTTETQGVAS